MNSKSQEVASMYQLTRALITFLAGDCAPSFPLFIHSILIISCVESELRLFSTWIGSIVEYRRQRHFLLPLATIPPLSSSGVVLVDSSLHFWHNTFRFRHSIRRLISCESWLSVDLETIFKYIWRERKRIWWGRNFMRKWWKENEEKREKDERTDQV